MTIFMIYSYSIGWDKSKSHPTTKNLCGVGSNCYMSMYLNSLLPITPQTLLGKSEGSTISNIGAWATPQTKNVSKWHPSSLWETLIIMIIHLRCYLCHKPNGPTNYYNNNPWNHTTVHFVNYEEQVQRLTLTFHLEDFFQLWMWIILKAIVVIDHHLKAKSLLLTIP